MNIIDIVLGAILLISVIYGFYRGFLQSVASLIGLALSLMLAFTFAPMLSQSLASNQGLTTTLASYTNAVARVGDFDLASSPVNTVSQSALDMILTSVSLPKPLADELQKNIKTQAFEKSGLTTVNEYVSNTLVSSALSVLCFILCFFACYLLFSLLTSLLRHVFRFPILRQLDWLAGGAFGLLRGAALCYVLLLLLPLFKTIIPDEQWAPLTQSSQLMPFFTSDGLFMKIITGKPS